MKAIPFSISETNELAAVRDLAYRIWPASYAHFLSPEQINTMLARIYSMDALNAELKHGHRFFLAQQHDEPVGYASAYRDGDVAWLKKLYLLPECRGTGAGAQLLSAALAPFAEATQQRLLVNPDNKSARAFYEHLGFNHVGDTEVNMGGYRFTDCVYARPCAR